jgi:protein-S-isoprenylcysteine O-methyltransferase Ste14
MRVAAGSACAARSIAQIVWRVDIALEPSSSTVKVADQGKVRVNRKLNAPLFTDSSPSNQAAWDDRSALLPDRYMQESSMSTDTNDLTRYALLRSVLSILVFATLLFAPAGTLHYWQAGLYGLVFIAGTATISVYFLKHDPKLVERRMKVGPRAETEPAQKVIMTIILLGFLLLAIVPGLDHRWHWSTVPVWLALTANAAVALSFVVFFVVMKQNSYAASTIRVEVGQPVVSTGLYGSVRHPMYSGGLLLMLSTPLALGSYWGLLIAVTILPALIWRLLDEERYLKLNLPGYADYCRRVHYRLVPHVW